MASAEVVLAEVFLADGRLVTTDSTHEPELYWAQRGGGRHVSIEPFGIVPVAVDRRNFS